MNLSLLTTISRKVISFSDISAVNLMSGSNLLAGSIKLSKSFLSLSQRKKISSVYPLHSFCLVSLCCISVVSILAVKILANDTAILDGSMCFKIVLSIELERIFV